MVTSKSDELRKKFASYFDDNEYPAFTGEELEALQLWYMDLNAITKNDDELGGNDGSQTSKE